MAVKIDIQQRVRFGDIWQLGNHLLLCGDCSHPEHVKVLMEGEKVDLMFTSPPYDKQREYKGRPFDWTGLMCGMATCLPRFKDDGQILVNLGLVHKDGQWVNYWEDWLDFMARRTWRQFGWYVWDKGSALSGDWHGRLAPCFEFVFHFNRQARQPNKFVPCKDAGKPVHGTKLRSTSGAARSEKAGFGGLTANCKIPDAVIRMPREQQPGLPTQHPAVFPVALPQFVIEAYTQRGEVVYEPFSGGGTTIIAGQLTGRVVRAIEIEPTYCDIALARFQQGGGRVRLIANICEG